jgi:ABC-2 type transport system permease protein
MMVPRRRAGRPDWLVIARRELLERVRTRWFVAVTLLGPILMIGVILIPALLARAADHTARVQIVDHSGRLGPMLVTSLGQVDWKAEVVPLDTSEALLLDRIHRDQIDGFLVIPAGMPGAGTVVYQGDNATSMMAMQELAAVITQSAQALRGLDAQVAPETLERVLAPVAFAHQHTTGKAGASSGQSAFVIGYAVMFVLYMSIVLYATNVLRSVVQEKTSRIMEIMVAAAKPHALMLGKIVGVGAAGLLQISIWATMAALTLTYRGTLLSAFGVEATNWSVPPLTVVDVIVVLGYFLLGYFFYAAIYAAIGAMVSTEQEAQQAQTPIIMLLIIPVASVQLIADDPRGPVAEVLTLIPFSSAILMPMRWLLGGASVASLLISLLVLAASTVLVTRVAARIYRVGILMYGKRPSLRELARWLRY